MAGLLSPGFVSAGLLGLPLGAGAQAGLAARPAQAPVQAAPQSIPGPRSQGLLGNALTYILGGREGVEYERTRPQREAMARMRLEAQQGLAGLFGGAPPAGQPAQGGMSAAGGPVSPSMGGGLPSLRSAAPILARAQFAGVEGIGDLVNILDKVQPDIDVANGIAYDRNDPANVNRRIGVNLTNVNGFQVDPNDPSNNGRYFPDIPEGATPLYDGEGRVVAIRNLDGAVQSIAEQERARNDARNASQASYAGAIKGAEAAAEAPYQIETVTGPDGAPIVTSRANLLAQGGIVGQTPADAVIAEGDAKNRVGALEDARVRAAASNRILPQLQTMENLLADINSGFGADVRTGFDRFAATLPLGSLNDGAERRASATQTFQNEARQVVSGILPLFGANPTEGERKYAEAMSGADVNYTPEALAEGIRLARDRARRNQESYDRLLAERQGSRRPQSNARPQVSADQARAILRARGVPGY